MRLVKLKKGYHVKAKEGSNLCTMVDAVGRVESIIDIRGNEKDNGCLVCVWFSNWKFGGNCLGKVKDGEGWIFKREHLEVTNEPLTDCSLKIY